MENTVNYLFYGNIDVGWNCVNHWSLIDKYMQKQFPMCKRFNCAKSRDSVNILYFV